MNTLSIQQHAKDHRKPRQIAKAAQLRALGHSIRETAKLTNLNPSTIQRLTPNELNDARELILSQETENAKRSAVELAKRIGGASDAVLNAIHGTAVDKMLALTGESQMTIRHEHLHAHLSDEDLLQAMLERKAQRLRLQSSTSDAAQ